MFEFSSIEQYHAQLKEGKTTCVQAVEFYLQGINAVPHLNAFIEIYADEALHLAGIHPSRSGASLNVDEIEKLHAAIRTVLQRGIDKHGSSLGGSILTNYRRPNGELGQMQDEFQVYDRKGEACRTCGKPIQHMVIAQRSSHFCEECQK